MQCSHKQHHKQKYNSNNEKSNKDKFVNVCYYQTLFWDLYATLIKVTSSRSKGYLVRFPTPNPKKKQKKFSLKKFLIFFRKKIFLNFGISADLAQNEEISYTPGWLLIKHRKGKFFITWNDCWFSVPGGLFKLKCETKKIYPNFYQKSFLYLPVNLT